MSAAPLYIAFPTAMRLHAGQTIHKISGRSRLTFPTPAQAYAAYIADPQDGGAPGVFQVAADIPGDPETVRVVRRIGGATYDPKGSAERLAAPMTFEQWRRALVRAQLAYIKGERVRMAKAAKLLQRYTAGMNALGLHPLTRTEQDNRARELDQMEREAPEQYPDTDALRAAYEGRTATE